MRIKQTFEHWSPAALEKRVRGWLMFSVDLTAVPAIAWVFALGVLLRFINLGAESIWYDEAFTVWLAKLDLPHMFAAIPGDVHPPLWYVLEWVIVRVFGSSEAALRLPSAIFGLLCILLVYRVAGLMQLPEKIRLTAALLACIFPGALYYSQDARMYTFLSFLVLWMIISLIKKRPHWFAVAAVLALYTHNLAIFFVGVLGITWAFTTLGRKDWRGFAVVLATGAAILIGYLPWVPSLLAEASHVKQSFWMLPLDFGQAIMPVMTLSAGWRLGDVLQLNVYAASLGMTVVSLWIGWLALRPYWRLSDGFQFYIWAAMLGAPVVLAVVSVFWRSVFLPRALLPCIYLLMIFWAVALVSVTGANRRVMRLILIPALGAGIVAHYFPATGRFPARQWVAPVAQGWQADDVVYSMAIDGYVMAGYYLPDKANAILPQATDLSQSLSTETKAAMGFHQISFDKLSGLGFRRAWVIASDTSLSSRAELDGLQEIINDHPSTLIESWDNGHIKQWIYLVEL